MCLMLKDQYAHFVPDLAVRQSLGSREFEIPKTPQKCMLSLSSFCGGVLQCLCLTRIK